MGGFFGITSKNDCIDDLFYGTDYHSHLGTKRGGMAVIEPNQGFVRVIHNIENAQFRSKFESEKNKMHANTGIGVISDYEDQPILIRSHLGDYAIVTVGVISNIEELAKKGLKKKGFHFSEFKDKEINPTEMVAALINQGDTFEEGIKIVQDTIQGSCSMLLLTEKGIYAARDKWGRTPVVTGKKEGSFAVTLENSAFPNLDFETDRYLGPGEIVFVTADGCEQRKEPETRMQVCAFLWVYYGYPASCYEGINVEWTRNRCGALLAKKEAESRPDIDCVAGIPDSGVGHGVGYAAEAGVPFTRPFVKYTPTWARSFMPQVQEEREKVARMKLVPIRKLIEEKSLLFCEDSIVRGTQLRDTIQRLYDFGAREVHMRPACPPLVYSCKFLNFSRSKSEMDLAARKAIHEIEGENVEDFSQYTQPGTEKYEQMIESICKRLNLTSLKYQHLEDLVEAIGIPVEDLCTYCWNGNHRLS